MFLLESKDNAIYTFPLIWILVGNLKMECRCPLGGWNEEAAVETIAGRKDGDDIQEECSVASVWLFLQHHL